MQVLRLRYAPLRMTSLVEELGGKQIPPLRYGMTNKGTKTNKGQATTTARAKYRGLSTAAAKCAAFGRDDVFYRKCREEDVESAEKKT